MGRTGHRLGAVPLVVLMVLTASSASAAPTKASSSSGSGRAADPPVLVGPVRVKLVGGKVLEGIAVFREENKVRLILEDGTEIAFDPLKVASVTALADIGREPAGKGALVSARNIPPTPEISESDLKPSTGREKGRAKRSGAAVTERSAASGAAAAGKTSRTGRSAKMPAPESEVHERTKPSATRSVAAAVAVKVAEESAVRTTTGATVPGQGAAAGDAAAPPESGDVAPTAGSASSREERDRDEDIARLAAMLEHAIGNAELDRLRGSEDAGVSAGEGTEGVALEAQPSSESAAKKEESYSRPKPEDFDATRPVLQPGVRFIGKKGELPSMPLPLPDFPKPASPTVSLGPSIWHPSSGFGSSAKWPKPLPRATSFSNSLSGLAKPLTSLGPTWWNPKPITWPSSIFPDNWQPTDGFAQSQKSKETSSSTSGSKK